MKVNDPQAVLSDLARVKALFQARAVATVMGMPLPFPAPPVVRFAQAGGQIAEALEADSPPRNAHATAP